MTNPIELVPVALLSIELAEPIEDLARRLDGDVTVDDIGLRSVGVDIARRVITEHRERELAAAATMARNQARTAELAEKYRPRLPRAPSATELAEAGYSSPQEFMAAQMAADVEAAGGRRHHVFEDALDAGGHLVYRPFPRGDDQ